MGLRYRYRLEDISMTAPNEDLTPEQEDRRAFLASCGRFAAVTPPALTLLLCCLLPTQSRGLGRTAMAGRRVTTATATAVGTEAPTANTTAIADSNVAYALKWRGPP